jgi:hypothetical protein
MGPRHERTGRNACLRSAPRARIPIFVGTFTLTMMADNIEDVIREVSIVSEPGPAGEIDRTL